MNTDALRRDGCVLYGENQPLAARLRDRLARSVAYTAHVIPQGDRVARTLDNALARPHGFVCHEMADVLGTPGMFEWIVSARDQVRDYFGEPPLLYSVHAFWKKPNGAPGWHHDSDDGPKQLVMFMYGTDVPDDTGGVHAYVTGSHEWDRAKLKPWHNVQEDVSGPLPADWPLRHFYGPAGTTFLTDTRGLHNGFAPTTAPRLLVWARWCGSSGPPAAYRNDEIDKQRVPWRQVVPQKPDDVTQESTRLVVDWS